MKGHSSSAGTIPKQLQLITDTAAASTTGTADNRSDSSITIRNATSNLGTHPTPTAWFAIL